MEPFRKRTYRSFGEFAADLRHLWARRKQVRRLTSGKGLDPVFRERIMLAVTRVNACRFCTFAHSRAALQAGMTRGEVDTLLGGGFEDCPESELPAVLYAKDWAEAGGVADPEAERRLAETYGEEAAADILLALRIIRAGNLTGNTVDCFLHRVSFGRLGK